MAIRDLFERPDTTRKEDLSASLDVLARAERLLVALDFDGTLAPLVAHPNLARALPDSHLAVTRLNKLPETRVALVSGRAIDSLRYVAEPAPGVLLVGSHGLEFQLDEGEAPQIDLNTQEIRQVGQLTTVLQGVTRDIDQVWLEHKPAGVVLHTRQATAHDGEIAQELAVDEARNEIDGVTVKGGKDVVEFAVRRGDKGQALERLREYTAATAVLFIGDDLTDEDGFAVLRDGDMGIHVGAQETRARYRVADPQAVSRVITRLADRREAALAR